MTVKEKRKHIKVTYSTLSSPDPLLHTYYEEDVETAKENFGRTQKMLINGEWLTAEKTFQTHSPIDKSLIVGTFQDASADDVDTAVAAAKAAFPAWRDTPWQERADLLDKVANRISDQLFYIAAVLSLEVGKNRLEAIGDVEEAADLIRYGTEAMRQNNGFEHVMKSESPKHHNKSVLKPYGVWGVISPFNFPAALSIGPAGAALMTGNTVVLKPAPEAPLTAVLLAKCVEEAGVPAGVFNLVTGGDEAGKALTANPDVAGLTFTGSYPVGTSILRSFAVGGNYVRPVVIEMGGKNATIVTQHADLDKAAQGVMRAAFGLTGQKCSACSRVYVHESVKDAFTDKLVQMTNDLVIGDPTQRETFMGPIVNETAYKAYQKYVADLAKAGNILTGGKTLGGDGYFVAPTIADNLPEEHYLWKHEMFAPVLTMASYADPDEAMKRANHDTYGLTAGLFSEDEDEIQWFFDNIEAGVLYVNRASSATTGTWPGYQSYGSRKGSTGTNKAAGS